MYKNYSIKDLENFLDKSNFRLLKKYKFPFFFLKIEFTVWIVLIEKDRMNATSVSQVPATLTS